MSGPEFNVSFMMHITTWYPNHEDHQQHPVAKTNRKLCAWKGTENNHHSKRLNSKRLAACLWRKLQGEQSESALLNGNKEQSMPFFFTLCVFKNQLFLLTFREQLCYKKSH